MQHIREHTASIHPIANDVGLHHLVKAEPARFVHHEVTLPFAMR